MRLRFRRFLARVHLWLGLPLSILFLLWCVSGLALMYSGYTSGVAEEDRLERLHPVPVEAVAVGPDEALQVAEVASPSTLRMESLLGVPVYRIQRPEGGWVTVRADTGERLDSLTMEESRALAAEFFGGGASVLDGTVERADVWTLSGVPGSAFPLHWFWMDDCSRTLIHVSPGQAEVANRSTRTERILAFSGAVLHFLYLPQLRREAGLWRWTVVGLSALGAALCLMGLLLGLFFLRGPRIRRSHPGISRSPFVGWRKWHHVLGLAFGVVLFTWTLSGMFSLDPGYNPSSEPSPAERTAIAGGPLDPELFRIPVERAVDRVRGELVVKEVKWVRFLGVPYYLLRETPERTRLVRADMEQDPVPLRRLPMDELAVAAGAAFPGVPVLEVAVLDEYDLYYYSRDRLYDRSTALPLPVLRIKLGDAGRTWVYMDPQNARMAARRDRVSRAHRWVFNFLHSFDLPVLRSNRVARESLLLLLLAGATLVSFTAVWLTGRWVKNKMAGPRLPRNGSRPRPRGTAATSALVGVGQKRD
jgi:hypothetical protein